MNERRKVFVVPYDKFHRLTIISAFALSFLLITYHLILNIMQAGNRWQQGDWLINRHAFEIRRGPLGSIILELSDYVNMSPLLMTAAIQVFLLSALFFLCAWLFFKLPSSGVLLLIFCPAFLIIFWAAVPGGSLRKEILSYVALLLLIAAFYLERFEVFFLACCLMILGFYGHEANVLFLPLFLTIAGLGIRESRHKYICSAVVFLTTIAAAHAFFYAMSNLSSTEISKICESLVNRGLNEEMCSGAIAWLDKDAGYATDRLVNRINFATMFWFTISYVMALTPILYFATRCDRHNLMSIIVMASAVPFLPLYFFGIDWGRWMNFHITSVVFLFMFLIITGRVSFIRTFSPRIVTAMVFTSFFWSPQHTMGIIPGGVVRRILSDSYSIVSRLFS